MIIGIKLVLSMVLSVLFYLVFAQVMPDFHYVVRGVFTVLSVVLVVSLATMLSKTEGQTNDEG